MKQCKKCGKQQFLLADDICVSCREEILKLALENIPVKGYSGKVELECPECGKTKKVLRPFWEPLERKCTKCKKAEISESEKAVNKKVYEERMKYVCDNVPVKYIKSKPDKYHDKRIRFLWGKHGTGKTFSSYGSAIKLYMEGSISDFRISTGLRLLNEMKAAQPRNDLYFQLCEVDFLCIDEVDKIIGSSWDEKNIFDIINYRYERDKWTVLIANASSQTQLEKIIGTGLFDRFKKSLVFYGGDSRR